MCSDEATIRGRIDKVRNDKVPPRTYFKYANDFINQIVRQVGVGSPVSVDEVRREQCTAQQRARYKMSEATLNCNPSNRLQAFIKAEPYSSVNDPRNITTMAPELTVMLSCYTMAFKNSVLKGLSWFGPGKTPKQTVNELYRIGRKCKEWLVVDYSRLDGTVSEFLQRNVMMAAYMRWVAPDYRAELQHCLNQVFIQQGRTAHNIKFEPGYGTRSGSPVTTDGNTMICAYVVYCALRNLGYSSKSAFKDIGLVYGDDGAFAALPGLAEQLQGVSGALGLQIKLDTVSNNEPVSYLGRYFVDPLTTYDSFQDPVRTLGKVHLTANKSVSVNQALANKAHGYLATDAKTPLIGTWARKVIELTGLKPKGLLREEQHKLSNAWPQRNADLIKECIAESA